MRFVVSVVSLFVCSASFSEVLAVCGSSEGHAYYAAVPETPAKAAGWQADRITAGSFQLIRSGTDYDIIATDSTGGTFSAKADGGVITASRDAKGNLLVVVIYPGKVLETYIFWFGSKSERVVTYSQAKHASTFPKHSLMRSTCEW